MSPPASGAAAAPVAVVLAAEGADIQASREQRRVARREEAKKKQAAADGQCQLFLPTKKRFCKFEQAPGSKYCAVHNGGGAGESCDADARAGHVRKRIPCPLDPNHSVYEDQLKSHLKKCSKLVQMAFTEAQPCYRPGCNFLENIPGTLQHGGNDAFLASLSRARFRFADFGVSDEVAEEFAEEGAEGGDAELPREPGKATENPQEADGEREHDIEPAVRERSRRASVRKWGPVLEAVFEEAVELSWPGNTGVAAALREGGFRGGRPMRSCTCRQAGTSDLAEAVSERIAALDSSGRREAGKVQGSKHHRQNRLLLEHFAGSGVYGGSRRAIHVEYGCGKAALSRWLHSAAQEEGRRRREEGAAGGAEFDEPSFFMVEREARRNKAENKKLEREENEEEDGDREGAALSRFRLDIADFDLLSLLHGDHTGDSESPGAGRGKLLLQPKHREQIEALTEQIRSVRENVWCVDAHARKDLVVHAKHLCGGATDLALSSLLRLKRAGPPVPAARGFATRLKVGIASCCHHGCDTRTYVGFSFLEEAITRASQRKGGEHGRLGGDVGTGPRGSSTFTLHELFDVLVATSSWAVFGGKSSSGKQAKDAEEKLVLGRIAKRLLDLGRLDFCRKELNCGNTGLVNYCPLDASPENGLLLAEEG